MVSLKNKTNFFFLLFFAFTTSAQTSFKFDFGNGKPAPGYIKILPTTIYSNTLGYGFFSANNLSAVNRTGTNALHNDYITSTAPFFFSVKLPEGNYNVKVTVGDVQGTSNNTIKAECRRLMVQQIDTKKGQYKTISFTVNVRDSIIKTTGQSVKLKERELNYYHWDDKLTLEFNNTQPKICAIEITPNSNATTIFLAGNSTVVDQADEPYAAWGQMFPVFFQPDKIAIANYAESGESASSFINGRRLEKILSLMKTGDYLFIEFAHNDQKQKGEGIGPWTSYKASLQYFIEKTRKKGGTPILVTSMLRRNFDSLGHVNNTLGDYPDAMRQTAKEQNVALIDLNVMSKTMYEAWGADSSIKAFVHYPANTFPGQTNKLTDNTHFNNYGAYQLAKCIVQAMQTNKMPLAKYLVPGIPAFNPAKPDSFENFTLPFSPLRITQKPDGN